MTAAGGKRDIVGGAGGPMLAAGKAAGKSGAGRAVKGCRDRPSDAMSIFGYWLDGVTHQVAARDTIHTPLAETGQR